MSRQRLQISLTVLSSKDDSDSKTLANSSSGTSAQLRERSCAHRNQVVFIPIKRAAVAWGVKAHSLQLDGSILWLKLPAETELSLRMNHRSMRTASMYVAKWKGR